MRPRVTYFVLTVLAPTLVAAQQNAQPTLPVVSSAASSTSAVPQEKPRVFVAGKGSDNLTGAGSAGGGRHWGAWGSRSTVDSHDESMEVTKDLQQSCSGIILTLNQSVADYTVMLNRESKQNRGLLRTNSQVQVANRVGDILGTNATHTVGNAAKDACALILADWHSKGPLNVPAASSAASPDPATSSMTGHEASQSQTPQQVNVSAQSPGPTATTTCSLTVNSMPTGADIQVDGAFVGNTPSTLSLASGNHQIIVRKKGFADWSRTLTVTGGNISLNATLDPSAN